MPAQEQFSPLKNKGTNASMDIKLEPALRGNENLGIAHVMPSLNTCKEPQCSLLDAFFHLAHDGGRMRGIYDELSNQRSDPITEDASIQPEPGDPFSDSIFADHEAVQVIDSVLQSTLPDFIDPRMDERRMTICC